MTSREETTLDDKRLHKKTQAKTTRKEPKRYELNPTYTRRTETIRDGPSHGNRRIEALIFFFAFVAAYLLLAYNGGEFYLYVKNQMSVALV